MFSHLSALRSIIDSRSIRERVMILVTAVVTPLVILDTAFMVNHNESYEQLVKEVSRAQKQILDLKIAEKNYLIGHAKDPNKDMDAQIAEVSTQLEGLNKRLQSVTAHLIPAGKMTDTVKEILAMPEGLLLTRVVTQPSRPYFPATDGKPADLGSEANIYVHTLNIEFQGSYQETLGYLKRLEGLPWKMNWEQIALNGENYPKLEITLKIAFLSMEKELIGV